MSRVVNGEVWSVDTTLRLTRMFVNKCIPHNRERVDHALEANCEEENRRSSKRSGPDAFNLAVEGEDVVVYD